MQSKYSITTIPAEFAKEGLGEFVCAFSSKNAKGSHPIFKYADYLFLLGVLCGIIASLASVCDSEDSPIFMNSTAFAAASLSLVVCITPFRIYCYFRDKNNIKNIYIYAGGFIWETYRKKRLNDLRVFNYNDDVDIALHRTDRLFNGVYLVSNYKLIVDYYDFKQERRKKFKLNAVERNRHENPEKFTWMVLSMRYIYDTWINYKYPE